MLSTNTNCSSRDLPRSKTYTDRDIKTAIVVAITCGTAERVRERELPIGRKLIRLAAMESWLSRSRQHSCRGTWLNWLWSAVRFCRETQLCRRSGRHTSWFIDTSKVSSSCRSLTSGGSTQTHNRECDKNVSVCVRILKDKQQKDDSCSNKGESLEFISILID